MRDGGLCTDLPVIKIICISIKDTPIVPYGPYLATTPAMLLLAELAVVAHARTLLD